MHTDNIFYVCVQYCTLLQFTKHFVAETLFLFLFSMKSLMKKEIQFLIKPLKMNKTIISIYKLKRICITHRQHFKLHEQ